MAQLKSEPDPIRQTAGIQVFDQYGDVIILETLSKGNILLWDDIMAQSWERVFTKMRINKDTQEFEKKYHDLLSKKK